MSISSPLSLPKPSVKSVTQLLPNRLPGGPGSLPTCGEAWPGPKHQKREKTPLRGGTIGFLL